MSDVIKKGLQILFSYLKEINNGDKTKIIKTLPR